MRTTLVASLLAVAACTTAATDEPSKGPAGGKADDGAASSCPVEGGADEILAAIEGAGSCFSAAGIAEACAFGSNIDRSFVDAATTVCSSGFGEMSSADQERYAALLDRCVVTYQDFDGSLYRSLAAHCQLEVTRYFQILYPVTEIGEDAVPYTEACPVDAEDAEVIDAAIAEAPSCGTAADLVSQCGWGSSVDVLFAAAATEHCAAPSEELQPLYDELVTGCNELYQDEEGTLYKSLRAQCELQVAVIFDILDRDVE